MAAPWPRSRRHTPSFSAIEGTGFDQAGAFHTVGDDHIGFLFGDATPAKVTDASKVSFMEVTTGQEARPDAQRVLTPSPGSYA